MVKIETLNGLELPPFVKREVVSMLGNDVEIYHHEQGKTFNVEPLLKDPEDFHGDPNVHHLVRFKGSFTSLIGMNQNREFGITTPNTYVMEDYYPGAKDVIANISRMARQLIENPNLYDNQQLARSYFEYTKKGYDYIADFRKSYDTGFSHVSLERAGLVSTRAAMGNESDALLMNEARVVTKRTHLKNEPDDHLAVTVTWRDKQARKLLHHNTVVLADFVSPASGASAIAMVLAARQRGIHINEIIHKSIMATSQGIDYSRRVFDEIGINSSFYSVGIAHELNEKYYLTDIPVGDAGHILRLMLPKWYQQ